MSPRRRIRSLLLLVVAAQFVLAPSSLTPVAAVPLSASSWPTPALGLASRVDCPRGFVALTFDDGPGRHTAAVLDVLERSDVPGVFFVLGSLASARPELLRRAAANGHQVANHGETHAAMTRLTSAQIRMEIRRTDQAIRRAGVTPLPLLRPPYGAWDGPGGRVAGAAAAEGYRVILWTVDPQDYRATSAQIRSRVLANLHTGAVILLHDGTGNAPAMVAALPGIIAGARERGYCFGTLSSSGRVIALVEDAPAPPPPPTPVDLPVVGDWDGDGVMTVGVRRGDRFLLRNSNSGGVADVDFRFGR